MREDNSPTPPGAAQTTTEMERTMEKDLPLHEGFTVDNGGVVLLWPFLERYFSLLGLQQNGAFLSDSHKWRAVHLLRYLSHGSMEAPEHALLLNKILCGLDRAAPPEPGGPLTEQERTVSSQLLGAVTQNWSKLKNTDAEGLRSAFLRRDAHLVREEHHWGLLVRGGPFDVLLPSLPWDLGTIRLSWMERIIKVRW